MEYIALAIKKNNSQNVFFLNHYYKSNPAFCA